jgi:tRNA(His) 5'-end guanylyltransferase
VLPDHHKTANFDCRVFQVPTLEAATAQLLWRENDAVKNSIAMLAQSMFSHKELQGLDRNQMQDKMMVEKGVNWNDLESKFKRGSYVKRIKVLKPFTADELQVLPKEHNARKNPDLIIERFEIKEMNYPIFNAIANKVDVVFNDALPIARAEKEYL